MRFPASSPAGPASLGEFFSEFALQAERACTLDPTVEVLRDRYGDAGFGDGGPCPEWASGWLPLVPLSPARSALALRRILGHLERRLETTAGVDPGSEGEKESLAKTRR